MKSSKAFNIVVLLIVLWTIKAIKSPGIPVLKRDPLIEQYFLVCGFDYLCDSSLWWTFIQPTTEYREQTNQCPECFCDDKCLSRGDCCPDLYFSLPNQTCTSTTIMNYTHNFEIERRTSHYSIVSSCPPGSDPNITSICMADMEDVEKMTIPVVTSRAFPLTYKNQYCAECNHEHVDSLYIWPLSIECVFFADFNFLSSYTEIVNQVKERYCYVRYTPPEPNLVRGCLQDTRPSVSVIDSCNQTGTWETYDPVIEQACESMYSVQYRWYKNIFCYMCNPPKVLTQKIIDVCNDTGLWFPDDNTLNFRCMFEGVSPYTKPFKNIFCYLCNRINTKTVSYLEADVNIIEFPFKNKENENKNENMTNIENEYVYEININSIRYNYMVEFYRKMGFINVKTHRRFVPNVTSLAYQSVATFPRDMFCRNQVPLQHFLDKFVQARSCSCEDNCMFHDFSKGTYVPCCEYTGLELPTTCIGRRGIAKTRIPYDFRYLVVSGCQKSYTSNTNMIRDRCENDAPSDLLSYLPLTDTTSNVQYSNTDCYVCREIFKFANGDPGAEAGFLNLGQNHLYAVPWNVRITCPTILETGHHVYVYDIIKLAEELGCMVDLIPYTNANNVTPVSVSSDDSDIASRYNGDSSNGSTANVIKWTPTVCQSISVPSYPGWEACNATGHWRLEDPDVRYACENTSYGQLMEYFGYKNIYCYMCNPKTPFKENVISTCNETGVWLVYDPDVEYACENFPRVCVTRNNRFKNVFCEICNSRSYRTGVPRTRRPNGNVFNFAYSHSTEEFTWDDPGYVNTYRNMFSLAKYDEDEELDNSVGCAALTQIYDANIVSQLHLKGFS